MRATFIGCPGSGKTTTAFAAFAALKEMGIPCEFVPEYARLHIAAKRAGTGGPLTDEDQVSILLTQAKWESDVWKSVGDSVVSISDTSPWNSLLYLSDPVTERYARLVQYLLARRPALYRLVFWSMLPDGASLPIIDPNRVHSLGESHLIEDRISDRILPHFDVIPLTGPPTFRLATVLTRIDAALKAQGAR